MLKSLKGPRIGTKLMLLGLTLLFALAQTPLMRRHHLATEEVSGEETATPGED